MKRCMALDEIVAILSDEYPDQWWGSYVLDADRILTKLEEMGMTPPPYETGETMPDPDFGTLSVIKREWEK